MPLLILVWSHKFLRSKNKMAEGCKPIGLFVQNFKYIEPLWKIGNYDVMTAIYTIYCMTSWRPSWFFFPKRKQHKITQDIHMYLHNKFRQESSLEFLQKKNLTYDDIAAIRSTSNLKWDALQTKLNFMVKSPCLYHLWFWGSSRHKLSREKNQNIRFAINVKTT